MNEEMPTTPPQASEAVRELTHHVATRITEMVERLSGIALRDAGLRPEDGWRYVPETMEYVRHD